MMTMRGTYTHKKQPDGKWAVFSPFGRKIATGMSWRVARSFAACKNAMRGQS